ncbi:LADA_0H14246g1_1 [Lachancea dasiensis]|uniref:LADA_0H14246g1_1 n=1 Tax=Lachancea dasiensis TaxID=1072105 RepID=A0A1G4K4D0_9SACH|nr:LADA_0H14246g1_1 [Lachancea dasiensis]
MRMEDILTQRAEISGLLDTIVKTHRRYLFEVQDAGTLDKLRNDIHICLNDLCKLNAMLTSSDDGGSVKQEIDRLAKLGRKLEKLEREETSIRDALQDWKAGEEEEEYATTTEEPEGDTFTFTTGYRHFLNRYLDRVGVTNTSLANANELPDDPKPDKSKTTRNIAFLRSSQKQIQLTISEVEILLATLKKDQNFIEQELQSRNSEVDSVLVLLSNDLERVQSSQEKIMTKLGISGHSARGDSTFFSRFNKLHLQEPLQPLSDQLEYAKEFLFTRQEILNADLRNFKEDLNLAESARNTWDECLNKISALENLLKTMLSENPLVSPQRLSVEIAQVITNLQEAISSNNSPVLRECLGNEIEVLKRANQELFLRNSKNSSPGPVREASSNFSIAGTSPPKIGLNRENITFQGGLKEPLPTPSVGLDKMQKKE